MTKIQEIFTEDKLNLKEEIKDKIDPLFTFLKNTKSNEKEVKENILELLNIFKKKIEIAQVFASSTKFNSNNGLVESLIDIFLIRDNLREDSKTLLKFLIENINFEKKYYDYIYSKIGKEHREETLNPKNLLNYIKLLLLFYGKDIENKDDKNDKTKYLFFLNPKESLIKTNISKENKIYLRKGFSLYIKFAIYKESDNENCDLIDCEFDNKHHLIIKLEKNIIKVNYGGKYDNKSEVKINEDEYDKWIIIKLEINDEKQFNLTKLIQISNNGNEEKIEKEEEKGKRERKRT